MAHSHTHDNIDWSARLTALRRADELEARYHRQVADRLVELVGADGRPTVVDVGSGGGGMSAAFVAALAARAGGRVVLSDAVPELLESATERVRAVAAGIAVTTGEVAAGIEVRTGGEVAVGTGMGVGTEVGVGTGMGVGTEVAVGAEVVVEAVRADAADGRLAEQLPAADLVWASRVVHHLPDQQLAIDGLARVLAPGGWLALSEGGLATRCLPWDLGVGDPGLGDRLTAARDRWFVGMRGDMPGSTSLPVGWNKALAAAGLTEVFSFSYLVDHPAPPSAAVRESVVDWVAWMSNVGDDLLSATDRETVARLVDPADDAYVGARDDVFILSASTVHLGRKPAD